jgi:hypothetical protein
MAQNAVSGGTSSGGGRFARSSAIPGHTAAAGPQRRTPARAGGGAVHAACAGGGGAHSALRAGCAAHGDGPSTRPPTRVARGRLAHPPGLQLRGRARAARAGALLSSRMAQDRVRRLGGASDVRSHFFAADASRLVSRSASPIRA